MFLSESEDESDQLHSDLDSESENSSLDEDYIPKGLARGSDQWVQIHRVGFRPTEYEIPRLN